LDLRRSGTAAGLRAGAGEAGRPVDERRPLRDRGVFYGALSDVEYTITVTDTQTGAVKKYFNAQGQLSSVSDTSAF